MSMYPSTTLIESTLDLYTSGTPFVALYTSNPGPGNTGTELTGGSYIRKAVTFSATVSGARTNTAEIRFPSLPTATITHFAIFSAVTGGTFRAYGALSASMASISGDELVIAANALSIGFAGS